MELGLDVAIILFVSAFVAGFIDAIAGGGGLITIPALLAVGFPPAVALGTNKLQACGGSFSASLYFVRKKAVDLKQIWLLILLTFIGGSIGTILVQMIDVNALKVALPFLILIIGCYFLFSPSLGDEQRRQRMSFPMFACTAAMGIGFYDGLFGPATGSFFTLAFVLLLGFNLTQSVAHSKVLNFTSNLASLIFFIIGGAILWKIGFLMMIGQFIGASLGARMVVTKGKQIIRPLIVMISFIMVVKMLWDQSYFAFIG
ncbi:TSUP family transporter [Glaesserella parasuis]|uniref:TSUP family transporter n=1 Tax=Glaesserella parasuis TaxID=738 RepID=UPI0013228F85|nr:TSUP family transporter [Glaesserella parasuis]MDG6452126.1 TSUP family transporter [Glaesserella parasuis]MWP95489.1 TSUP family transporter [Glaesserella parasuis]MWP96936.1 TSUP family transporter [Glaesserella parasuis]MWQ52540.1 TSUP family transporter [Glaesserella parasuis]MWQ59181.1 TSUP family transporter [Glaesserella parasuis]